MTLPNKYTQNPNTIFEYFAAIRRRKAPIRFNVKYLEQMGFVCINDQSIVGVLKELKFLTPYGVPEKRYHDFLDRSKSKRVLAAAIRELYSSLFAVKKNVNMLGLDDVKKLLKKLYKGEKSDLTIGRIAGTFLALCAHADFSETPTTPEVKHDKAIEIRFSKDKIAAAKRKMKSVSTAVLQDKLPVHINIILPKTKDQTVYDAFFKSLEAQFGKKKG